MTWRKTFLVNGVEVEAVKVDGLPNGVPWVDAVTAYRAAGNDILAAGLYTLRLVENHCDRLRFTPEGLPLAPPSEVGLMVAKCIRDGLCPPETLDEMAIGFASVVEQLAQEDPGFKAWLDANRDLICAEVGGSA